MKVTLAKSAGFCFGVKRAVNTVYEEIEKGHFPLYTFGPIIHNDEVVKELENHGVHVISSLDELNKYEPGTMIIRSHGIGRFEQETIESHGYRIVDATCPFVLKIHRLVEEYSENGYHIVIFGNEQHPEVQGIRGWVSKDCPVTFINSVEDAMAFSLNIDEKACIVSQTTFNINKFQELVEIIDKKGYDIKVLNTICNATEVRQTEAKQIASVSDAMIVIGDRNSSNTQKLFEICSKECENTYYIQTANDMDFDRLQDTSSVGITAGASTPNNIIEEVSNYVIRI